MTLTDMEIEDRMNRSSVDIDSDNETGDDGERDSNRGKARLRHAAHTDFVKSAKSSKVYVCGFLKFF